MIDVSDIGASSAWTSARANTTPPPSPRPGRRTPRGVGKLQAKHGMVLVAVDQPAPIGALPLAVVRDMGWPVAYLLGLTMRRIADLYPGEAKSDASDGFPHQQPLARPADADPHVAESWARSVPRPRSARPDAAGW